MDEHNAEAWRTPFGAQRSRCATKKSSRTSKELSISLAEVGPPISVIESELRLGIETEKGALKKLMKAFQEAAGPRSRRRRGSQTCYAQTIAYGLLSARHRRPEKKKTADDFAAHMRTNPFPGARLMETFSQSRRAAGGGKGGRAGKSTFDELGVSEVVELLDHGQTWRLSFRDFR